MGIEGGSNGALDLDWQQKGARRKSLLVTSTGCEAYVGGGGAHLEAAQQASGSKRGYRRQGGSEDELPIKR